MAGAHDRCAAALIAFAILFPGLAGGAFAAEMYPSDVHEGGALPSRVATGDFDGDGITDVASLAQGQSGIGPGDLRVFLGNGDGSFRPMPVISFAPKFTSNLLVGDLNGDGKTDLVVTLQGVNSFKVFLSNGDGTFTSAPDAGSGTSAPRGWLADFTGDGKLDLLVKRGSTTPTIEVLPGRGDGTFAPSTTGPVAEPSIGGGFAAADVNHDGKMDLVTSASGSTPGIRTFLGNGDGTFTYVAGLPVGTANSLILDDFDRDGRLDLLLGGTSASPAMTMYRGNGDGTFQQPAAWQFSWDAPITGLTSGDINRDGWPDIVVSDFVDARIFFGTGGGNVALHEVLEASDGPIATALGEFDGQGGRDLALVGFQAFAVYMFLSDNDGTFARLTPNPIPVPITFGGRTPALLADLNGDGLNDLVGIHCAGSGNCTQVAVAPGLATGGFGTPVFFPVGINPQSIAAADLNGDLIPDLVVTNPEWYSGTPINGTVSILIGVGNGTFLPQVKYPVGLVPDAIAVGDLDGDGDLDIAVVNRADPDAGIPLTGDMSILAGNGNGTFAPEFRLSTGRAPKDVVIADLNGDGHPDLATVQAGKYPTLPAELALMPGNGTLSFPTRTVIAQGLWFDSLTAGDLDGDGDVDLITTDAGDMPIAFDILGESKVFLNNGAGSFTASAPMVGGAWPLTGSLQDLNGDGFDDFVVFNNCCAGGTGDVAIFPGRGDGTFGTPERHQVYGLGPVLMGQFDADPRPDIVVVSDQAYSILNIGVPAPEIRVAASGLVSWQGVPLCAGYDVVKGDLSLLLSSGLTSAILGCPYQRGLTQSVLDLQVPSLGHGFFYMARAIKQTGDPGTYDGEGPGQVAPRDSAIDASGLACP